MKRARSFSFHYRSMKCTRRYCKMNKQTLNYSQAKNSLHYLVFIFQMWSVGRGASVTQQCQFLAIERYCKISVKLTNPNFYIRFDIPSPAWINPHYRYCRYSTFLRYLIQNFPPRQISSKKNVSKVNLITNHSNYNIVTHL